MEVVEVKQAEFHSLNGHGNSDEIETHEETSNPQAAQTGQQLGTQNSLEGSNYNQALQFGRDEEKGISWTRIQAEARQQNYIIIGFAGELFNLKIERISERKKMKFLKLEPSTFLTVTSQLAGSLLGVTKQGSGTSTSGAEFKALLYTSAICNFSGFLAFFVGVWLKSNKPGAAWGLEIVGSAFTVVGFLGMVTALFL